MNRLDNWLVKKEIALPITNVVQTAASVLKYAKNHLD
jgi:hypothetical protein